MPTYFDRFGLPVTTRSSEAADQFMAGMERDGSTLWSGSITGPETVVTAPATQLVGARAGADYWRVQGTSFPAPMVSGPAARETRNWP